MGIFDFIKRGQSESQPSSPLTGNPELMEKFPEQKRDRETKEEKIGKEQIRKAYQTLLDYKKGKTNLEERIVANEEWWKLRHWGQIRSNKEDRDIEPTSAWLHNCLNNKHADAMDNFPRPNVLPREEGDKQEAEILSDILPVILDQNDFEKTYSDLWTYKLKTGTGVYGVFWNKDKMNGLGDIDIRKIDILNLFWEPGVTDIQDSPHLFHVQLQDNELLERAYPQLQKNLSSPLLNLSQYIYDDTIDTSKKSAVIDWYYKVRENGKTILHFCKFVNETVLYATENESEPVYDESGRPVSRPLAETGLYDHGRYPFEFDVQFPAEGTPAGFGYLDICKSPQEYIDRLNQCILKSALMSTNPRFFIRNDGSVNEEEFSDWSKPFIHTNGANLGEDSIRQLKVDTLSGIYVDILNSKINELKETSGNRDFAQGGTTAGVTAASAIAALQEAGNKLSRDAIKQSYRTYRRIITLVIELIRQFYTQPRTFRILGEGGVQKFIQYSNAGIRPQAQGMEFGVDGGYRIPEFDIEISAEKATPYTRMSNNELALQFYQAGFFNPQIADQAAACLEMMDFDRKDEVLHKVTQNGMMFQQIQILQQQMIQMAAIIDKQNGSNMSAQLAAGFGSQIMQPEPEKGSAEMKKGSLADQARENTREGTSP